ncbi:MAG: malate synthase A, partial [Acidobacteriota bacterium]|nr:malate synthase A [Acidobacteriota bacterium]
MPARERRVELAGAADGRRREILSEGATRFLAELSGEFESRRRELLERRRVRAAAIRAGELPDFLADTRHAREAEWQVAAIPADLLDRRVEITGPTDRKMIINALNSDAN